MAAPQPGQPRSWAGLATANIHEILARVPCPADRHRALLACRAWRDAASELPPPPPPRALPWLLLPTPHPAGSARVACVLSGCRVHHYLDTVPPDARCFGSHDGAWLFLHLREPRSHQLLNVRTGDVHFLPTVLREDREPLAPRDRNVDFLAAALSAPPEDPLCVLAGIVSPWPVDGDDPHRHPMALTPQRQCRLALWSMEKQEGLDIGLCSTAEDVVHHEDVFLFLNRREHLRVAMLVQDQDGGLAVEQDSRLFRHPGGRVDAQLVRSRYLVVSRGELLMVVRIKPRPQEPWTSAFRVFLAERYSPPDAYDTFFPFARYYSWAWRELDTLGGRVLFVRRGCSRSYEVDQYPSFTEGIYFLDDGEFYDEAVIFANGDERQFRCSDNGKWSQQGHVQRCFPRPDHPSNRSPPAWLLP